MPTTDIYFKNQRQLGELEKIIPDLKTFLAEKLTCGDITLSSDEISVRFIKTEGNGMIGEVEVEINAASFKERVDKQDEICLEVVDFIKSRAPSVGEVKVWLILSELGHSWK